MVAETAPSVLTKASLSSPTESSDVKSAHGLFSLEVWSQEEIRVLKKVHLSVPLELHDFWREVSSRYNRWMSDSYGSEAPFRSARECQDVWFEVISCILPLLFFSLKKACLADAKQGLAS
jgi:hypothetical protein